MLTEKPGHGSSDSFIQLPYQSPAQSEQVIWFKQPIGKPRYGPTAPKQIVLMCSKAAPTSPPGRQTPHLEEVWDLIARRSI